MFRKLAYLLIAAILATGSSPAAAQSELDRARERVAELQAEIDRLFEQVKAAQSRADAAGVSYWDADEGLHVLELQIEEAAQREAELSGQVEAMREQITEIAVERYINSGRTSYILAGEDLSRQAALDALARFLREGTLDIIDEYRQVLDDQATVKELLAFQAKQQQDLMSSADATHSTLIEELDEITEIYIEAAKKLNEQDEILEALEEEERRRIAEELRKKRAEQARRIEAARRAAAERAAAEEAAKALAAAEEAAKALAAAVEPEREQTLSADGGAPQSPQSPPPPPSPPPPVSQTSLQTASGWVCPLAGPFSYVDDYGAPRHYGGWHKGNDLIAPTGTPVLATENGRLEHRFNRIGGLSAYIYADSGNYYYNTHLSAYENEGVGWVPAGTVIGYVGETGNAPIPHLHFEYHKGGRGNYINPYPVVRDACF